MSQYIEDNLPSVEEYILYVGEQEAIEQSNPDDASATEPEENKIEQAIDLAKQEVLATFCIACPPGKVLISKIIKPLVLDITRYRLDTIKRREDVKEAYEKACEILDKANSDDVCSREVSSEDAETFGIEICPGVSFSSQERIWTRDKLETFRKQPYLTGNITRRRNSRFYNKY